MVSNKKLSTVVPANVTGDDKSHDLTNMDLAMKLHYLKALYVFEASEALLGLSIHDLKEPMFQWLDLYYVAAGRIRRSETGRPHVKCNDSGIRIVEAASDNTVGEMLRDISLQQGLVFNQVLGPHLSFSPLVFIQFTRFKCGGISVGLSWAHVLGDAFSASAFINMWGQILSGHVPPKPLHVPTLELPIISSITSENSLCLKRVDSVGDYWLATNTYKMDTHSFRITSKQLHTMVTMSNTIPKLSEFEVLSAIMWKSISRINDDLLDLKTVTICKNRNSEISKDEFPSNAMVVGVVKTDFSISESNVSDLATLIATEMIVENEVIEKTVEEDDGKSDFLVYGANLTFIDMLQTNIYGLELKGDVPIFANYSIEGVGKEGVVLVLPGPKNGDGNNDCLVTVILPENQLIELKNEVYKNWNI